MCKYVKTTKGCLRNPLALLSRKVAILKPQRKPCEIPSSACSAPALPYEHGCRQLCCYVNIYITIIR